MLELMVLMLLFEVYGLRGRLVIFSANSGLSHRQLVPLHLVHGVSKDVNVDYARDLLLVVLNLQLGIPER